MGDIGLAQALGYKDANYTNQIKNGHTKLGNKNAERWCKTLKLRSGWFDREPPGEGRSEEIYQIFSEATEEQMISAMRAVSEVAPRDAALQIARFFLDRASAQDQEP